MRVPIVLGCALAVVGLADTVSAGAGPQARLQRGDTLWLMLADSTVIEGTFEGLGRIPADRYQARYDQWRHDSAAGSALPDLGGPIELVSGRMWAHRGLFGGFALGGVDVSEKNRDMLETIEFSRFEILAVHGGKRWKRQDLERLYLEGKAPLLTALRVQVGGEERQVPFDDVLEIRRNASAPALEPRAAAVRRQASSHGLLAIEAGTLWVSNSDAAANGLFLRASPGAWKKLLGLDASIGVLRDQHGGGPNVFNLQMAAAASLPLGTKVILQPRIGVGGYFASGGRTANWFSGAGLMTRLGRSFGLRLDYEYVRLVESEEWAASSLHLGPFWAW